MLLVLDERSVGRWCPLPAGLMECVQAMLWVGMLEPIKQHISEGCIPWNCCVEPFFFAYFHGQH